MYIAGPSSPPLPNPLPPRPLPSPSLPLRQLHRLLSAASCMSTSSEDGMEDNIKFVAQEAAPCAMAMDEMKEHQNTMQSYRVLGSVCLLICQYEMN